MKPNLDNDFLSHSELQMAKTTASLILDIAKMLEDRITNQSAPLKIPSGARRVLSCLSINDGCTQLDLIRATHLKAPTISLIVQKMEQDGLITRKTDDIDMRLIRVYLTEKGTIMYKSLRDIIDSVEAELFASLDETEKELLHSLLSRIF